MPPGRQDTRTEPGAGADRGPGSVHVRAVLSFLKGFAMDISPNDIYALPSIERSGWYDHHQNLMEKAFGFDLYSDLDYSAAEQAGDDRLMVDTKLTFHVDLGGSRSSSVYAVSLDGKPFGVFVASGRGEADHGAFFVTDKDLHREARAHLARWRHETGWTKFVDADATVPGIASFYGTSLAKSGVGYRLAQPEHVAADGNLVFDAEAFRSAIMDVRREYLAANPGKAKFPIHNAAMRKAIAETIVRSVPSDLRCVVVNELGGEKGDRFRPWTGAAVATEEGTYLIGLEPAYYDANEFSWMERIAVERIGGPELIESYGAEAEASLPRP